MQNLDDGMLLYHGSYCEVASPDLQKCAPYKDFGKGFYVTTSYDQAKNFVATSLKKAKAQKLVNEAQEHGVITIFRYMPFGSVHVKIYEEANAEWLHCIVAHRKNRIFQDLIKEMEEYDIIAGKIADDATNFTISAYMAGTYGEVGTVDADKLCINRLIPERLKDQYCFRTGVALHNLKYTGSEKIWIN